MANTQGTRRRWLVVVIALFLLAAVVIGGFGTYMASEAGRLPWQEDPTRIPITPFAYLPGVDTTPEAPATPSAMLWLP
jgi:predicted metal-binding protein